MFPWSLLGEVMIRAAIFGGLAASFSLGSSLLRAPFFGIAIPFLAGTYTYALCARAGEPGWGALLSFCTVAAGILAVVAIHRVVIVRGQVFPADLLAIACALLIAAIALGNDVVGVVPLSAPSFSTHRTLWWATTFSLSVAGMLILWRSGLVSRVHDAMHDSLQAAHALGLTARCAQLCVGVMLLLALWGGSLLFADRTALTPHTIGANSALFFGLTMLSGRSPLRALFMGMFWVIALFAIGWASSQFVAQALLWCTVLATLLVRSRGVSRLSALA